MNELHRFLEERSTFYKGWHRRPEYGLQHFIVFTAIAVMAFTTVQGGIHEAYSYGGPASAIVPSARGLTTQLLQAAKNYEKAPRNSKLAAFASLKNAALARKETLKDEIMKDPSAAALDLLPDDALLQMPSVISQYLESDTNVEGSIEVYHADGADGKGPNAHRTEAEEEAASEYLYDVVGNDGSHTHVYFADHAPADLLTGQHVSIRGKKIDDVLAAGGVGSVTVAASNPSVLSGTFGKVKTLVILVNFSDEQTQPFTQVSAQSSMTTTSDFDMENSFDQTSLTGVKDTTANADVTNWVTIAESSTACNYNTIASEAQQAASAAGYTLSNYNRYVYAMAGNACSWWGLGTVGGNPAQAWVNAKYGFSVNVIGHEMGHNFGLYHSHSLACVSGSCSMSEYGDSYDIMGGGHAHYNAFQKERLGWLNYNASPPLTTVSASGQYAIAPYETKDTQSKAIKTLVNSANNTYLYAEYRTGIGFDNGSGPAVHLHEASASDPNSSDLWDLDQTTSTNDWTLDVGQSYTDALSGKTFTLLSASATSGAVIAVDFGTPACVTGKPTMSVSPSSQTAGEGKALTYNVSLTNNDSAGCPSETFGLTPSVPAGWGASLASTLTAQPGSSVSTSFTVTSALTSADGSYGFSVSASNASSSETAAAQATYVVYTPVPDTTAPSVSIIYPPDGSAVKGSSVTISASATDNVGVTKVEFAIDGKLVATDTSSPYNYKWNIRKASPGSHMVSVNAYDATGNKGTASITVTK